MILKTYVHAKWDKYDKRWNYCLKESDYTEYGYLLLEIKDVVFESPDDKALQAGIVAAMRKQRQAVLAAAAVEANNIQQDIDELLAIEDKS